MAARTGIPADVLQTHRAGALRPAPLQQSFPTQRHSAPCPPPSSVLPHLWMFSASPQTFFNILSSLTIFARYHGVLQLTGPPSQRPRGGLVVLCAAHRVGQTSSTAIILSPQSTAFPGLTPMSIPSLGQRALIPSLLAQQLQRHVVNEKQIQHIKIQRVLLKTNRGFRKKDGSTEFNIYAPVVAACSEVLPELESFLQALGRMVYSYLKPPFVSPVTNTW